jgi:hypothetical protein
MGPRIVFIVTGFSSLAPSVLEQHDKTQLEEHAGCSAHRAAGA